MTLLVNEFLITGIIVLLLLLDFMIKDKKEIIGVVFSALMFGMMLFVMFFNRKGILLGGAFVADGIAWFSKIIILAAAFLTGLMSVNTIKVSKKYTAAYYILLACSTLGLMFLVSSKELITLYVGLELATISLYALSAIYKNDDLSLEAGIKYIILGAVSSGILLYGLSLIYGVTRTTYLDGIMNYASTGLINPVFIMALIMTLLGVGFKLSMVPMHVWTPDVYQGAPTPVTAFISVASKAAGFVFALRLFAYMFIRLDYVWVPILSIIAFLTMTIGNLMAIPQKNVKRLLAYSTISQAGYILVGFVGASVIGISSVMFYLLAYTITNIAAFAVVAAFAKSTGSEELDDYAGLAQKEPLLALIFMFALLSLAGIPPLAGFVGKFFLFYAAMQRGYVWLVVAGALNSTVSLYYYLLVLRQMYLTDRKKELPKVVMPLGIKLTLLITMIAIFVLGLMPGPVLDMTTEIAQKLFLK
jgi:NADH-quinone oxidoreductase subunit N